MTSDIGRRAAETGPGATDAGRLIPFRVVFLAMGLMLAVALILKLPPFSGLSNYSDIIPFYKSRHLNQGRFPYLDTPVEYPVLTGLFMGVAAKLAANTSTFFILNAVGLASCGLVTAVILFRLTGNRSLYFVLAPSILLYAYLNWDLLAVALATGAVWAYLSRRPFLAGALVGLGVSAKLYPGLLLVAFALDAARRREIEASVKIAVAAVISWLAVNLPFAIVAFRNWSVFYRFSAKRGTEFNTLWSVGCHRVFGHLRCTHIGLINFLSLVLFVVGALVVWRLKVRQDPDFPRWTLAFPLLLLFLLTTKIYSPQYALWVLPWFALVLPDFRLFLVFELTDVLVYITEFSWLRRFAGYGGLPVWPVEIAIVVRAVVLTAMLVAYVRRSEPALEAVSSG